MTDDLDAVVELLDSANHVAVMTGAGVSKASGIPTFRDGPDAWWGQVNPLKLLTQASFDRDPGAVWGWHLHKRRLSLSKGPNAAHEVLAALERRPYASFTLVTQNIDGLHARAGSSGVLELHGSVHRARCERCGHLYELDDLGQDDEALPRCPACGEVLRPDVVWFGDDLDARVLSSSQRAFAEADLALVIGTSAQVYPAASLPTLTLRGGGQLVEINPEDTPLSRFADVRVTDAAWADGLLDSLEN
ncbi:SIR2 family NAD-dependent protein deacylase [Deinococcus pimensis]|uniref:SIR2 family NAD-dependent protein deacylase n=1 Tax=Deinococcus pimensis TaxID=309888 RepID=UPI0005EB0705|nr:NAD-dependent deacylase [Deinococcus pimensis]